MDITKWSILKSDWLYSLQPLMQKLYTVSRNKTERWLWLRSWTPYFQIQTSIEQSRENHQTIQVWPKSNPLQIQGVSSEGQSIWRYLDRGSWQHRGGNDQDHPQENKCKKAKWLSEEALQIAEKRKEAKGKGEKERYTHLKARVPKTSKER